MNLPSENFRARMREARTAKRITQEQLAATLGQSQSFIARIETGTARVTIDDAVTIANRLDVPLYDMLNEQPLIFEVVRAVR